MVKKNDQVRFVYCTEEQYKKLQSEIKESESRNDSKEDDEDEVILDDN